MEFVDLITYCAQAVAVIAALFVVFARNSVQAVLFLVLTFVATSAIWLILEAEFLAVSLILVYVGAVMVLFLFVVMMLDIEVSISKELHVKHWPIAMIVALLVFAVLYVGVVNDIRLNIAPMVSDISNIKELGLRLYTYYLYPFELAGVILLVAIIAAISLTFKGIRKRKSQNPHEQVQVLKEDRLKIIKMSSDKE